MERIKASYSELLGLIQEAQEIRGPVELFFDVRDYIPITREQVLQILATTSTPEIFEYDVIWNPKVGLLLIN